LVGKSSGDKKEFFMKKLTVVLGALTALLVLSCGTAAPAASPGTPSWFLKPPTAEDYIYGVGTATMSNRNLAKQASETRARLSLAQAMNTRIQGMATDFGAASENDPEAQTYYETITRTLTQANLQGATVDEVAELVDGGQFTYFALVKIPTSAVKQQAIGALAQNPNKALADKALADMDAAFDRYNSPSPQVSTGN
jgi:hypothetical protein